MSGKVRPHLWANIAMPLGRDMSAGSWRRGGGFARRLAAVLGVADGGEGVMMWKISAQMACLLQCRAPAGRGLPKSSHLPRDWVCSRANNRWWLAAAIAIALWLCPWTASAGGVHMPCAHGWFARIHTANISVVASFRVGVSCLAVCTKHHE